MKKNIQSLFLVLSLTVGMLFVTACSNSHDEEEDAPFVLPTDQDDDPAIVEESNILTTRCGELNHDMSGLNFKDLAPLYERLTQMTPANRAIGVVTNRAIDMDAFLAAFCPKLAALIDLLRGDNAEIPYGRRFTFKSFNDVLEATWDVSGSLILGMDGNTFFVENVAEGHAEMSIQVQDGITYTLLADVNKDTYIADWNINVTSARLLSIYKNEELVLKITSGSERKSALWLPFLPKESTFDGEIAYKDYLIDLAVERESAHQRHVDLIYSTVDSTVPIMVMTAEVTDDANIIKLLKHDITFSADYKVTALDGMLSFIGTIQNINYMVVDGVKLASLMEKGTTSKDDCDKVVRDFNDNLTLEMYVSDLDLGTVFMGTVYDTVNEVYKPTIMVNSPLLGSQDYVLTDILMSMGVNMDGVMQAVAYLDD